MGRSLTLLLPDRKIYLFNVHAGMQQLWMSSPISGGRHFASSPEEVLVSPITDLFLNAVKLLNVVNFH
jgi:frataxin-like iron-binding protein CyaY